MDAELQKKYEELRESIRVLGSAAVAFSGGADSTLLLRVAHDVLAEKVLAVTATSETYPAAELESARRLASEIGAPQVVIETKELDIPGFRENPPDRCYHCKRELMLRVRAIAEEHGLACVADGTNADDSGDWRPGARASAELGVRSPLRDAGLTKADVRALSRELGLPTWDKPAYACLASRFPYGTQITREGLERVERAEAVLHELGFEQCRVRVHGEVARVEVERWEVARAAEGETARRIAEGLHGAGFRYVAVDLDGYRMGSMNEERNSPRTNTDRKSEHSTSDTQHPTRTSAALIRRWMLDVEC